METDSNISLLQITEKCLHHIAKPNLQAFVDTLYPQSHSPNVFERLLHGIMNRVQAHSSKGMLDSQITDEILWKSQLFGPELKQAICKLFENDFIEKIRQKLATKLKIAKTHNISMKNKENGTQSLIKLGSDLNKLYSELKGTTQQIANIETSSCLCNINAFHTPKDNFKCINCGHQFHQHCMGKKYVQETNSCLKCHLKLMYPNKQVKKVLFVGRISKEYSRHEFSFRHQEEIAKGLKMQIRCIRLKYESNLFTLFPDVAKIEINGNTIKQFNPLHRLSSLKFRKDEPITIHQYGKQFKITINEQLGKRQPKQDRIQHSDHLIGFYLIEELSVHSLHQQIQENNFNTFSESADMLNSLLRTDNNKTQEVTLQNLQITLVCPLSTDKIKIAARGQYCRHFQCFDLHNYLIMIAHSSNPRWICPICKRLSYGIRLDRILNAIIAQNTSQSKQQEVRFYPNGDYCVGDGQQFKEKDMKNIKYLSGQCGLKRRQSQQVEGRKRRKVICLD